MSLAKPNIDPQYAAEVADTLNDWLLCPYTRHALLVWVTASLELWISHDRFARISAPSWSTVCCVSSTESGLKPRMTSSRWGKRCRSHDLASHRYYPGLSQWHRGSLSNRVAGGAVAPRRRVSGKVHR